MARSRSTRWRLLEMMGLRRIRTAAELRRRLQKVHVEYSPAQLSRLIGQTEMPKRLSRDLLLGLLEVLDCELSDLLVVERAPSRERHRRDPHE